MIDITKQYTYNGKPVRIYADGSDTLYGYIHCSVQDDNGKWYIPYGDTSESDLVEVWQPKEGEWCYFWDDVYSIVITTLRAINPTNEYRYKVISGSNYRYSAPFTGELPEAFKGLQNGK